MVKIKKIREIPSKIKIIREKKLDEKTLEEEITEEDIENFAKTITGRRMKTDSTLETEEIRRQTPLRTQGTTERETEESSQNASYISPQQEARAYQEQNYISVQRQGGEQGERQGTFRRISKEEASPVLQQSNISQSQEQFMRNREETFRNSNNLQGEQGPEKTYTAAEEREEIGEKRKANWRR
jgi:hypothetical protein